jgi:hypothetical protein
VVFGEKQEKPGDHSGTLSLGAGKVVRLAGWRFFKGDAVQGTSPTTPRR